MLGCRPSAFPFEQRTKLDKGEEKARVDSTQYGRLVGQLLYLQATRPNIKYVVNVLSQFVAGPRKNHSKATNRVLRYLKGTPGQGILLPPDGPSNLFLQFTQTKALIQTCNTHKIYANLKNSNPFKNH